ncbi:MAG: ABC transporter substrate-binding protein [Burkholderiaceae bacterium]
MTRPDRRRLLQSAAAGAGASLFGVPMSVLAQAARGGTVVVGTTQRPRHLNPAVQSGLATMMPGAQLFATPMGIDDAWQPTPMLAERWTVSEDARSITLALRKDAVFHDGRPITAEDVQFSVEAVRDNHPFKSMFAPVNAVTLTDRHTAVIRLAEPHPALALAMTTVFLPILPKHVYGDGAPLPTHPRNATNVVGSGPFKVVEFKPGEHLIMERFDRFFIKDRPLLDRLIIREFKDPTSLLLAFERGEVDVNIALTDPRDVERARKVSGATVVSDMARGIGPLIWLAFNCKHPQLQDKRVRQAISFAVDREFITKTLFSGMHKRATGPIGSASPLYTAEVERYDLNLQKATQLLDAAGLKPGANGMRTQLSLDYIPGSADGRTTAEYIKPALAKVGIDVALRNSPDFPTWARRVSSYQYDLTLDSVWNWGDPVIGVHRTYLSSNIREGVIWSNTHQYSNPKVDELLAAAGRERDAARRKALYRDFQKIVVDDCPIAFLYEPNFSVGFRRVVDPKPSVWGMMAPLHAMATKG